MNYASTTNLIQRVGTVAISVLLVLFMTLYPFNFSSQPGFSVQYLLSYLYHPSNYSDFLVNIILFVPFGLSLTYLLFKKKLRGIGTLIVILLASFCLSFTVETLQIFLPSRTSTVSDILSNSLGGGLGFLGFYLLKLVVFNPVYKFFSLRVLTVCFISYATLTFIMSIPLAITTNLDNWNSNFPLLLGNEKTGNRPWNGYIFELYIVDRAISKTEVLRVFYRELSVSDFQDNLVAFYQFNGQGSYPEKTGNLPNLSWQGEVTNPQGENNVFLTPNHWLTTKTPANYMTKKIRQTSQFTVITTVATTNINQTIPARIISLSGNPYQRNFTLGQEGSNLIFRLRTPISGENGDKPELIVPGVFADTKPHHLVITYANSLLQIYIDQIENCHDLELTPMATMLNFIFPAQAYDLKFFAQFLYYGVVFIPLGFLLGLIKIIWRGNFLFKILLICNGILLPVVLLEVILASRSGRNISLGNFLLSLAIMSITMFLIVVGASTKTRKS